MGASLLAKSGVSMKCLCCGIDDHCTAKYKLDGAPVHEPPGGQGLLVLGLGVGVGLGLGCYWCGIHGHPYQDCPRRRPNALAQEQKHSATLKLEVNEQNIYGSDQFR